MSCKSLYVREKCDSKMEHILDELVGNCTGAAILSNTGIVWFTTPGFFTNTSEFQNFANIFVPNSKSIYDGINFQNQIYLTLTLSDEIYIGTTNTSHVIMCKCDNCIVFAYDENKTTYDKLHQVTMKIAQEIRENHLDQED